jgi:hypothetical protein
MENLMKNLIKTIAVNIFIIAGISHSAIVASPQEIARLQSFAANVYGYICKYPITAYPGLMKQTQSPAHFAHQIDASNLTTVSKQIIFDQEYFDKLVQKNDLKTLTASMIHEHTHLDQDHGILLLRAQIELQKQTKNTVSFVGDMNPGNTPDTILGLNRTLEERADAGVKRFPDLCLNQYHYFMKDGDREYKELQQELLNEKDPQMRSTIETVLKIFRSNNPELIKTVENGTHPNPYRRALYFKKWAQDGGLKNI